VSALTETFIKQRPLGEFTGGGLRGTSESQEMGEVTVDDAAIFLARLDGGAIATYEATRFAKGRKNGLKIEINGEHGSLVFDLERLNELELYLDDDDGTTQGFRRVLITEAEHPYMSAWWPAGHIIGWEHTFTHEARDLLEAIATGGNPAPSFADGLGVQLVLDAVERSAEAGSKWVDVEKL
jgi:predicted dehydrogenase